MPLAVAALVKPVVLPVAALVLDRARWTVWARSVAIGVVVCGAIAAPLLLADGGAPVAHLWETAERFRLKWAHFGGVYEPLLWTIEQARPQWTNDAQEVLARRICTAALAAVIVVAWWRPRRLARTLPSEPWGAARSVLTAMVLLSPAAHPWYLLWALVLVPMSFGWTAWVASLTITWGYAAWGHVATDGTPGWGIAPWLMFAAWVPVYVALVAELWSRCRRAN